MKSVPLLQSTLVLSTHRPESTLEHCHALGSLFLSICRSQSLYNVVDNVPELVMLFSDQHNKAGGLRVEAAGNGGDGVLDDLFELCIRDGGVLGELVDGATEVGRVL